MRQYHERPSAEDRGYDEFTDPSDRDVWWRVGASWGERYSGLAALFNADLHTVCPDYAPRTDFIVVSPHVIARADGEEPIVSMEKTLRSDEAMRRALGQYTLPGLDFGSLYI